MNPNDRTPTWIITEIRDDGWIRVQPNYHSVDLEAGQEIAVVQPETETHVEVPEEAVEAVDRGDRGRPRRPTERRGSWLTNYRRG